MTNDIDRAVEHLTEFADELSLRSDMIGNSIARVHGERLRLILSANREMRESLSPFAALADMVGESWTDETPAFVGADGVAITIGQLRKARSALTTQRGDGE